MAEYEEAGLSRDEALAKAIEDVAEDLDLSVEELSDLVTEVAEDLSGDIDTAKRDLLNKIDEAEQAGADRDAALGDAISDLAEELGITEEALLERIGESEESLRTAIGETEADLLRAISDTEGALTEEIQAVADLVGKPASEVTDTDIDFVADLIAQQETLEEGAAFDFTQEQLLYDVTGDQVVDQADLDLLQQAQQDPNVLFDLESKFAPTGIYATQQELAATAKATRHPTGTVRIAAAACKRSSTSQT
jgi:CRP-like cAMP-binding protein